MTQGDRVVAGIEGEARNSIRSATRLTAVAQRRRDAAGGVGGLLFEERHNANESCTRRAIREQAVHHRQGQGGDRHHRRVRRAAAAGAARRRRLLRREGLARGRRTRRRRRRPRPAAHASSARGCRAILDGRRPRAALVERPTRPGGRAGQRYGEAPIAVASYGEGGRAAADLRRLRGDPREYTLSVMQTVVRHPHPRLRSLQQPARPGPRATAPDDREHEGAPGERDHQQPRLRPAAQRRAVDAHPDPPGAPTPDDLDELLSRVWKEPAFFLAHPRAIAAFGRECTRRGVPPPTVSSSARRSSPGAACRSSRATSCW